MSLPLDEDAVLLAMRGLWTSYERHREHWREHALDAGLINISAVEVANWVCAIDEQLRETSGLSRAVWEQEQAADADGQAVPGVRYVRDRHMHQVVVSAQTDGANFFGSFPPQLSAGIVWRRVTDIPEGPASKRRLDSYQVSRSAYERHLQARPTWIALTQCGQWLTNAAAARGLPVRSWRPAH